MIQRLSYLMLFTVAIHIALVNPEDLFEILFTIFAYITVLILAYKNNRNKRDVILTYFLRLIDNIKVIIKKK